MRLLKMKIQVLLRIFICDLAYIISSMHFYCLNVTWISNAWPTDASLPFDPPQGYIQVAISSQSVGTAAGFCNVFSVPEQTCCWLVQISHPHSLTNHNARTMLEALRKKRHTTVHNLLKRNISNYWTTDRLLMYVWKLQRTVLNYGQRS